MHNREIVNFGGEIIFGDVQDNLDEHVEVTDSKLQVTVFYISLNQSKFVLLFCYLSPYVLLYLYIGLV